MRAASASMVTSATITLFRDRIVICQLGRAARSFDPSRFRLLKRSLISRHLISLNLLKYQWNGVQHDGLRRGRGGNSNGLCISLWSAHALGSEKLDSCHGSSR
jgi:hypothetical protein